MKIGVVSDTHSRELPKQMMDDFKGVDLILHAGDICSFENLNILKKIKGVKAVCGNMDESALCRTLPKREIIHCGKFSIGLIHGEGPPQTLMDKVVAEFKNTPVDAVVFGHSHSPVNKMIGKTLYFNPGSPNDKIFAPYQSYGILEINDKITGKIIKVR